MSPMTATFGMLGANTYLDKYTCHEFCLEKYHVIQCGYSIKCQPHLAQELYDQLGSDAHIVSSPFTTNGNYTINTLNAFKNLTNLEEIEDAIRAKDAADTTLPGFDFCKSFFKKFVYIF